MAFFVVTFTHPNEDGWRKHVMPHVEYLQTLLTDGSLKASGPFVGSPDRSAMLIFSVPDRATLDRLIAADPFAIEGLIEDMTVTEWDPIFGAFQGESSRRP